jgi:hypothetical protein
VYAYVFLSSLLTSSRPGAFAISFFLPILCYAFTFLCNDISGCPAPSLLHPSTLDFEQLKKEVGWPGFLGLVTWNAVLGNAAYYLLSLALYAFLPAEEPEGTELRTGGRLKYRFNGRPILLLDHLISLTMRSLELRHLHLGRPRGRDHC